MKFQFIAMIVVALLLPISLAVAQSAPVESGKTTQEPVDQAQALREHIHALEAELKQSRAELAELLKSEGPGAVADAAAANAVEAPIPEQPDPEQSGSSGSDQVEPESEGDQGVTPSVSRLPAWLRNWKSSIEFGLSGSEGNSRRQAVRVSFQSARKTERTETSIKSLFRMTSQQRSKTLSQFTFDARNDWLDPGPGDLRYFAEGKIEFDDAQAWDYRLSGFGGIGYAFIKDEKTTLVGRSGFGGSRRVGLANDEFRAEAFLAADLTHSISPKQKIKAGFQYLPDTSTWEDYRLNTDASWEVKIDPEKNLYLRVGVANRYDSDAGTARRNDLDYFMNLGWSF